MRRPSRGVSLLAAEVVLAESEGFHAAVLGPALGAYQLADVLAPQLPQLPSVRHSLA
jgi:hypothetical protein